MIYVANYRTSDTLYCEKCGTKTEERQIHDDNYDGNTGKKVMVDIRICVNEQCVCGCENTGGCKYPRHTLFDFLMSRRCLKCGNLEPD